jgi:hypothetical protein
MGDSSRNKRKASAITQDELPDCSPSPFPTPPSTAKKARRTAKPKKGEEKRLRQFRKSAPKSYRERLDRVRSQRMFLIDRKRTPSLDEYGGEEEVFDIAGTTGNIYQVTIARQPRCSCPDSQSGNQCKHIIYVRG